jgi:uncharacterized membrane protein
MTAMLRKDFDEFLFASVGNDANGNPLTLLTVLARLGVDPWEEAADLAHLSREPAMQRLASRLEAMPNAPASAADTVSIATRLIAVLHRAPSRQSALPEASKPEAPQPEAPQPEAPRSEKATKMPRGFRVALYWLIGLIFLLMAQWTLSSRPAQPAMDTSITAKSRQ